MLSKEHKSELFAWISQRLHWLKVVLIGNRSNGTHSSLLVMNVIEQDDELLERLKKGRETIFIHKYSCRLPISKIVNFCDIKGVTDKNIKTFVERWCTAARGLFSDDVLTLRLVDHMIKNYENKSAQVQLLAEMLLDKMPTLGPFVCKYFILHCKFNFKESFHIMLFTPYQNLKQQQVHQLGSW